MTSSDKVIRRTRATLVEAATRENGYTQRFVDVNGEHHLQCGITLAKGVNVGDTGTLEYRVGPSYGLEFFVPDTAAE